MTHSEIGGKEEANTCHVAALNEGSCKPNNAERRLRSSKCNCSRCARCVDDVVKPYVAPLSMLGALIFCVRVAESVQLQPTTRRQR